MTSQCVQVSNTQLVIVCRNERSAKWALPCCDLAPFRDSESFTHVHICHNNTTETHITACPIQKPFSQPSTHFTIVCQQQMAFGHQAKDVWERRDVSFVFYTSNAILFLLISEVFTEYHCAWWGKNSQKTNHLLCEFGCYMYKHRYGSTFLSLAPGPRLNLSSS